MLRAVLIGCGKIGSSFADDPKIDGVYAHAHAYAECEGVQLVGVCDADPHTAAQCGQRWQVSVVYTDYVRMLHELQPDIVSVCTPDASHLDVLQAVLQTDSVKGILAEKPLAASLDGAEQIVSLARARDVRLAVNYSRRYALSHQKLREQLPVRLGEIQSVNGFYTKGLLHNGTHWLDLLRFLCGPLQLLGCYPGLSPFDGDLPGDPSPTVVLQLASGAPAILTGLDAARFSLFEMDIVGSLGRVRLLDSGYRFEWRDVADSQYFSGYRALAHEVVESAGLQNVTLHALQDLLAACEQRRQPLCSGEDALAAQRLVSQARACIAA
jgi:predicted dehydrogenase